MPKRYLGINVLEAAKQRIAWVFDNFPRIYVSFSGGKDSTVVTHLVLDEAKRRGVKVGLFFLDWECQFNLTVKHVKNIFEFYSDHIDPYWVALPIRTWNGCSQSEPEWTAWDESKRDMWIRQKDSLSISDPLAFPFYYNNMMFEEFTPLFAQWYANGEKCASFLGIRTQESLNRYRTIARDKPMMDGKPWTTNVIDQSWNVYPIYDWNTNDIWTYFAKSGNQYNELYDRMHQSGMTIHQMRIDEPFGDTQRQSLWLYQVVEPETWAKMVARVAGANTAALYCKDRGNILGNNKITLPKGHTWKSFVGLLLNTMPPPTSEHYKNKIAVYVNWYSSRGYPKGIPDYADADLEAKGKVPSWRRICKTLLRNDYWCRGIGFSPTKTEAYTKYVNLMKARRNKWKIYPVK